MTKFEILKKSREDAARLSAEIPHMSGFEKMVAETLLMTWIKDCGLSDSKFSKIYFKVFEPMGYSAEEVLEEFERQNEKY